MFPNGLFFKFYYRDAERTNYECSAYECEDGYHVITWVMELEDLVGFQCYYHPGAPQYMYMETAIHWRVIALFVTGLLMLVLGIWGRSMSFTFTIIRNAFENENKPSLVFALNQRS